MQKLDVPAAGRRNSKPNGPHASPTSDPASITIELYDQPGHLIRRAQQIAVSVFFSTMGADITPVQYAILKCLQKRPGIDQVTLAQEVALDTSSTALTAVRLESKGWIERRLVSRGQRSLDLTVNGRGVLARLDTLMPEMQSSLLDGFSERDRAEFVRLLRQFTSMKNGMSRAPLRPKRPARPPLLQSIEA